MSIVITSTQIFRSNSAYGGRRTHSVYEPGEVHVPIISGDQESFILVSRDPRKALKTIRRHIRGLVRYIADE